MQKKKLKCFKIPNQEFLYYIGCWKVATRQGLKSWDILEMKDVDQQSMYEELVNLKEVFY